jgi:predicted ester cyclase
VAASIADLVKTFYAECWNKWNDSAIDGVLDVSFTARGSQGARITGLDGWRGYRDSIRHGSADLHHEIEELVCEDQRAAARLRYTGTHTGPLLGVPASGKPFDYCGAAFFTADHQRLTSVWVIGELDEFRRQVG